MFAEALAVVSGGNDYRVCKLRLLAKTRNEPRQLCVGIANFAVVTLLVTRGSRLVEDIRRVRIVEVEPDKEGCRVLGAGCWVLVLGVGCWVRGVGCWVRGAGCWVRGAGCGCWVSGAGCCDANQARAVSITAAADRSASSFSVAFGLRGILSS
jgi:hypothetical protein